MRGGLKLYTQAVELLDAASGTLVPATPSSSQCPHECWHVVTVASARRKRNQGSPWASTNESSISGTLSQGHPQTNWPQLKCCRQKSPYDTQASVTSVRTTPNPAAWLGSKRQWPCYTRHFAQRPHMGERSSSRSKKVSCGRIVLAGKSNIKS